MLKKLKERIKKSDRLYILARVVKRIDDPHLISLLKGYYDNDPNSLSIIIANPKHLAETKELVYAIQYGCNDLCTMGFGALLRDTLSDIAFAELIKYKPIVIWGKWTRYYESELEQYGENAFSYYFEQITEANSITKDQAYVAMDKIHPFLLHKAECYEVDEEDVEYFADLYKRYIVLNKATASYIADQMEKVFKGNKLLGVHARGTDFNINFKNHPKPITSQMYVEKAKELFRDGDYDKVFVASDDIELLDKFINAFGDKLVYYDDAFRTAGSVGPHGTKNARPLHHYRLGLEVLRDIYTLAHCDSLICGMSQVSFSARYINRSLGKKYNRFLLIDQEINKTGRVAKASLPIK